MNQIFNGQSLLQFKLNTGISLAGATTMRILWKDPNGLEGYWEVVSTDGMKLVYNPLVTDITVPGKWQMQAYVEIGGLTGYGNIVTQLFTTALNTIAL
jgi:hypothetical protein